MLKIEDSLTNFLNENIKNIIEDIKNLVKIKTFETDDNDLSKKKNIFRAFNYMKKMCIRDGVPFQGKESDYFIVGKHKQNSVLLLHHMDTVKIFNKEKWSCDPFKITKKKNTLFGRGVNDNKGPLVFSYYILLFMKKMKLSSFDNTSIFIGSAEESDWVGIHTYKKSYNEPKYAISPDGDYPLVNLERGKLIFKISKNINDNNFKINSPKNDGYIISNINVNGKRFKSELTKSRNPHRVKGVNVIEKIINFYPDLPNEISKLYFRVKEGIVSTEIKKNNNDSSETYAITNLSLKDDNLVFKIDLRFSEEKTKKNLVNYFIKDNWNVEIIEEIDKHYVSEDSNLVKTLMNSHNLITNRNDKPLSFSGISYARAFKNSVAFGTTFPNEKVNSHSYNENIDMKKMLISSNIIFRSLIKLND